MNEVRQGPVHRFVALALALLCLGVAGSALAAGTLDKVKESGKLVLGFSTDAAPYAYTDSSGNPAGFGVALCNKVAEGVKVDLQLRSLSTTFVPLQRGEAIAALQQGKVDLVCGIVPTLERRAAIDFSIPIMVSGAGVVVRRDAPARIMQALSGAPRTGATWRGSTDQAPVRGIVSVIGDSVVEQALMDALRQRRVIVEVQSVKDANEGLQSLAANRTNAFFADHAELLYAVARSRSPNDFVVLDRIYRRDRVAMGMRRDDSDFRLAVDRALSHLFRSPDINALYEASFGKPTPTITDFFQLVALPD
jgi:ABC-type amino acid transport substrate-binding protein